MGNSTEIPTKQINQIHNYVRLYSIKVLFTHATKKKNPYCILQNDRLMLTESKPNKIEKCKVFDF